MSKMHWFCPDCGPHVGADEDGCCATCGQDCGENVCLCVATVEERDELLDALEGIARLHLWTDVESNVTSASALWDEAHALEILDKHRRFRVIAGQGSRMVKGYWPENDPQRLEAPAL